MVYVTIWTTTSQSTVVSSRLGLLSVYGIASTVFSYQLNENAVVVKAHIQSLSSEIAVSDSKRAQDAPLLHSREQSIDTAGLVAQTPYSVAINIGLYCAMIVISHSFWELDLTSTLWLSFFGGLVAVLYNFSVASHDPELPCEFVFE